MAAHFDHRGANLAAQVAGHLFERRADLGIAGVDLGPQLAGNPLERRASLRVAGADLDP